MRLPRKALIGLWAALLLLGQQAPAQGANPLSTPEKTEKHRPVTLDDSGDNTKKVVLILAAAVILACIAAKLYNSFNQVPEGLTEESIEEFFKQNSLSMEEALKYSDDWE